MAGTSSRPSSPAPPVGKPGKTGALMPVEDALAQLLAMAEAAEADDADFFAGAGVEVAQWAVGGDAWWLWLVGLVPWHGDVWLWVEASMGFGLGLVSWAWFLGFGLSP